MIAYYQSPKSSIHDNIIEINQQPVTFITIILIIITLTHCVQDEEGKKVHQQFVKELQEAEKIIHERNQDPVRCLKEGKGMPYTLLMPSLGDLSIHPSIDTRPPGRSVLYKVI